MQFTKNQENVSNSQRTDDKQMLEDDADVGTIKAFKAAIIIMLHDRKENTGNEGKCRNYQQKNRNHKKEQINFKTEK